MKLLFRRVFVHLLTATNRPILWMSTLLHTLMGLSLVLIPQHISRVTSVAFFSDAPETYGLLLLGSSVIAVLALAHELRGHPVSVGTFWSFIPQQTLLMVTAASALYFITQGHYGDGTHVPGGAWHVGLDQLVYVLLAAFHPLGILRMHASILPITRARRGGIGVGDVHA